MDFDQSKENIQPLRGGRNPAQLGMALQAQTSRDAQLELDRQRLELENAINSYDGEDPLDNWYHYISWVEQSYPKHGHEGNLVALMEKCLGLFESDPRYKDDRRFCKLWIKYIDMHSEPLELYHMMYSNHLCRGCADLYKAWAYYHEAADDFQKANQILELGKQALAQPYEELEAAYQNLLLYIGQYNLHGREAAQRNLIEKRHALTALQTFPTGRIPSTRPASAHPSGGFGGGQNHQRTTTNVVAGISIFEDARGGGVAGPSDVGPQSIIAVARKQAVAKENAIKAGVWTTAGSKKRAAAPKTALPFTVHEDDSQDVSANFHRNVVRECLEDYSNWKPTITVAEPDDPKMVPVYPKKRVYIDQRTEYSIDELRSLRYLNNRKRKSSGHEAAMMEDSQAVAMEQVSSFAIYQSPQSQSRQLTLPPAQQTMMDTQVDARMLEPSRLEERTMLAQMAVSPALSPPRHSLSGAGWRSSSEMSTPNLSQANFTLDNTVGSSVVLPPAPKPKVMIYDQSMRDAPAHQPKGSAMKTPFKILSADDLAETGSRGGMDVAETAKAADGARPAAPPVISFNDDSSSSYENPIQELNASCNTQMFNLNAMHVSTPDTKRQGGALGVGVGGGMSMQEQTRKQLFAEPPRSHQVNPLSVIYEDSKSTFGSSMSAGAASTKPQSSSSSSSSSGSSVKQTTPEERSSYLAQNLMANAALRASLGLGDLISDASPVRPQFAADFSIYQSPAPPTLEPYNRTIPKPSKTQPLDEAPSNPFDSALIQQLLERVKFPGIHTDGYRRLYQLPKLVVKKEPIVIDNTEYVIEKMLGKGTYGVVYKAMNKKTRINVALKHQKPANQWEYYICREIQSRLQSEELRAQYMDVSTGYFTQDASILISDYIPYGSLLDVANLVKQKSGRIMKEILSVYFTLEMLRIVRSLHDIEIVHADIKPDNFLVMVRPDGSIGLQLIDFGCSIDMTLFPPNTAFTHRITTEDFICCEVRDGRPWSYHTDLFCVAASAHVLVFGTYISAMLQKKGDAWCINTRFQRNARVDLWNTLFSTLLNQQGGPAETTGLVYMLKEHLDAPNSLGADMRALVNLLKNR